MSFLPEKKTKVRLPLLRESTVCWWRKRAPVFCFLLMAIGLFLRLIYVKNTAFDISKHDLGYFVGLDASGIGSGHLGYIEYILKNRALPNFNPTTLWAFYHPPLFHLCAAILMQIWLFMGFPYETAWELTQLLPCLCIFVAVVAGYQILKEFQIDGIPLVLMTGFLSFFPALSYQAITMNNDAMSLMFGVLAALFAVRWYRNPTWGRLVGIALCIGLGMMTKLTVALVAPGVAILFLVKMLQTKKYAFYIKKYCVFGLICVPLGLFWSIRNLLLYGIPVTYVQALPQGSAQSVSGFRFWQRVGIFPLSDWIRIDSSWSSASPVGHPDYNIWTQTLRTALFDDNILTWRTPGDELQAKILMILGLLLAVVFAVTFFIGMAKASHISKMLRGFFTLSALIVFFHFCTFCFDFPVTCTMHFRYIMPLLFYGAVGFGLWWKTAPSKRYVRGIKAAICLSLVVFCALSAVLYLRGLPMIANEV